MTSADTSRVWLVTGSSSGFGLHIAQAALDRGERLVATARRPESLDDLVASAPDRVLAVGLDVTRTDQIDSAVAAALERFGRIDVLVNNAGYGSVGAVEELEMDDLRAVMDTMFFGAVEVGPLGIQVLIVEPGAFRTGLLGARMHASREIPAYAETAGMTRAGAAAMDGKQPGDPRKLAAAILAGLDAADAPLHLALGADAVEAIRAAQERRRADLKAWEEVSRDTDFDEVRA